MGVEACGDARRSGRKQRVDARGKRFCHDRVVPRELLPTFVVDFNEMVDDNAVLLSREDQRRDVDGQLVTMRAGARIRVQVDDLDEAVRPSMLSAVGIIEPNAVPDGHWASHVRWRCRIEAWDETSVA